MADNDIRNLITSTINQYLTPQRRFDAGRLPPANFPTDFIAPTTPRLFLGRQLCAVFNILVEAGDDGVDNHLNFFGSKFFGIRGA